MKSQTSALSSDLKVTINGKDSNRLSFDIVDIVFLVSQDDSKSEIFNSEFHAIQVELRRIKDNGEYFYSVNRFTIKEMAEWLEFSPEDLIDHLHDIAEDIHHASNRLKALGL